MVNLKKVIKYSISKLTWPKIYLLEISLNLTHTFNIGGFPKKVMLGTSTFLRITPYILV